MSTKKAHIIGQIQSRDQNKYKFKYIKQDINVGARSDGASNLLTSSFTYTLKNIPYLLLFTPVFNVTLVA